MYNLTTSINNKRLLKLHNNPKHPMFLMKQLVISYFKNFSIHDDLSEVVSVKNNFDDLLIPSDHPARAITDTYYVDETHVLRTHCTAHQTDLFIAGERAFLAIGDVYRKDTIDRTHYPVFHQVDGAKIVEKGIDPLDDLKETLEGLVNFLYPGKGYRFLEDYFPFTTPSLQMEVEMEDGNWMEILGCGVIQPDILKACGIEGTGWAFGMGLDRLLLHKCRIPDIRYLWSQDERFLSQFKNGLSIFKEYSKYPSTVRDISFWSNVISENSEGLWTSHNDFCEIARDIAGDVIESVSVVDRFEKSGKISYMYRLVYRSNERTLENEEVNEIQNKIRQLAMEIFAIELR